MCLSKTVFSKRCAVKELEVRCPSDVTEYGRYSFFLTLRAFVAFAIFSFELPIRDLSRRSREDESPDRRILGKTVELKSVYV